MISLLVVSPPVQSFHSYFSSEHSRLLMLWRQVVGFRRHVCELKSNTERLGGKIQNKWSRGGRASMDFPNSGTRK